MSMSSNETVNTTKDKIAEKTNQAFSDVKDTAKEVKSGLKNASSYVEDAANKAKKNAGDTANFVGSKICSASNLVTDEIRKNPVQSAFIALTIGVVGTLFFKRAAA